MDTMPRTVLLLGDMGCGKHSLIEYIGRRFNLEIEDISDDISLEVIDKITMRGSPKIYTINVAKLTTKNENVILKFLEEPLKNAYIILVAESRRAVINTVLNRCQVWEFAPYPDDYLRELVPAGVACPDNLLRVANTPGKISEYQSYPLTDMFSLATKMFNSMSSANFANAMTIGKYVAFKKEKDKYDFDLFLSVLLVVSRDNCVSGSPKCFEVYELTNELNNNKYIFNIDKKALFDTYLIKLKLLMGG
jgi:hypothetical protein